MSKFKSLEDQLGLSTVPYPNVNDGNLENIAAIDTADFNLKEREEAQAAILEESTYNTQEVVTLAKTSMDFLAGIAMPSVFQYFFPPVFVSVWLWLLSYVHKTRDFSKLALGLPRGFGKTTVIKIFILYCILFTEKKFILVISNTATLAENIISDVVDMLEEENIKKVFGDWKLGIEKDTLGLKKFGFRGRNIILAGIGAGTSLRGLNLKNNRPDVMIFEDIQSREQADSEIVSKNMETWMLGTAMKAKSPAGCLYVYVGNMYPTKHTILRKLKTNPKWIKFIAGGILADGTSLWEELQPIAQLLEEYENDLQMGRPEIFQSEVLNDENASLNNLVDFSLVPEYNIPDDEIHSGNFIIIDPSGFKKNSDACAIGYFEVHSALPVMKEVLNQRLSPLDTIKEALKIALRKNVRIVAIEATAYQATLSFWFKFVCDQMRITGIEAVEIYTGGYSKNSRILNMFKQYQKGEIRVHPSIRALVHLYITQFNPLTTNNEDDVLDVITYAPKVLELYGDYISSLCLIEDQAFLDLEVIEHNSAF